MRGRPHPQFTPEDGGSRRDGEDQYRSRSLWGKDTPKRLNGMADTCEVLEFDLSSPMATHESKPDDGRAACTSPEGPEARMAKELQSVRQADAHELRGVLAEWICVVTDCHMEAPNEQVFFEQLQDGVLLCKLMNGIQASTTPIEVEEVARGASGPSATIKSINNLNNFLAAAQSYGMSLQELFNTSDLQRHSPRVVESLYRIHKNWIQQQGSRTRSQMHALRMKSLRESRGMDAFNNSRSDGDEQQSADNTSSVSTGVVARMIEKCMAQMRDNLEEGDREGHGSKSKGGRFSLNKQDMVPMLEVLAKEFENRMAQKDEELAQLKADTARTAELEDQAAEKDKEIAELKAELGLTAEFNKKMLQKDEEIEELKRELELTMEFETAALSKASPTRPFPSQPEVDVEALQQELLVAHKRIEELEDKAKEMQARLDTLEAQKAHHEQTEVLMYNMEQRYGKLLQQNTDLYNQTLELKGNIRVACRVRPKLKHEVKGVETAVFLGPDPACSLSVAPTRSRDAARNFTFNRVFYSESTQEQIYSELQPLLRSVCDGFNLCIFAYGQTGSGKTHTMSGPEDCWKERGLVYRALEDLFKTQAERAEDVDYSVSVQAVEIYNEQVQDLLNEDLSGQNSKLEVHLNERGRSCVPDALQVSVATPQDILRVMGTAQKARATFATKMNERSSRSHSLVSIFLTARTKPRSQHSVALTSYSCMHLIDLAGSERVARSEAEGDRLKEAQHINKSLSALGDVIMALQQKQRHVPYRNSKLTMMLQDALERRGKVMMLAHVAPGMDSNSETMSTLYFAEKVAMVDIGSAQKSLGGVALSEFTRAEERAKALVRKVQEMEQNAQADERERARLNTELHIVTKERDRLACATQKMQRATSKRPSRASSLANSRPNSAANSPCMAGSPMRATPLTPAILVAKNSTRAVPPLPITRMASLQGSPAYNGPVSTRSNADYLATPKDRAGVDTRAVTARGALSLPREATSSGTIQVSPKTTARVQRCVRASSISETTPAHGMGITASQPVSEGGGSSPGAAVLLGELRAMDAVLKESKFNVGAVKGGCALTPGSLSDTEAKVKRTISKNRLVRRSGSMHETMAPKMGLQTPSGAQTARLSKSGSMSARRTQDTPRLADPCTPASMDCVGKTPRSSVRKKSNGLMTTPRGRWI